VHFLCNFNKHFFLCYFSGITFFFPGSHHVPLYICIFYKSRDLSLKSYQNKIK
jgi:hypothetical protein